MPNRHLRKRALPQTPPYADSVIRRLHHTQGPPDRSKPRQASRPVRGARHSRRNGGLGGHAAGKPPPRDAPFKRRALPLLPKRPAFGQNFPLVANVCSNPMCSLTSSLVEIMFTCDFVNRCSSNFAAFCPASSKRKTCSQRAGSFVHASPVSATSPAGAHRNQATNRTAARRQNAHGPLRAKHGRVPWRGRSRLTTARCRDRQAMRASASTPFALPGSHRPSRELAFLSPDLRLPQSRSWQRSYQARRSSRK